MWSIQITTTQKFLQIYLKNKRHNRVCRLLQPDQKQKQNHKREKLLSYRALFQWMKESGLILNQQNPLSAYEVSKKVLNLLRHNQTVQREDDGAVQFWRIKFYLRNYSSQISCWPDDRWKVCLTAGGGSKNRYQYCSDISGTILYLRALQGHSGRNLIDPLLQDNVIIQRGLFHHIYHIGCAFNLHSIINNGLIPGGQDSTKRQTVFFLPVDPRDKERDMALSDAPARSNSDMQGNDEARTTNRLKQTTSSDSIRRGWADSDRE